MLATLTRLWQFMYCISHNDVDSDCAYNKYLGGPKDLHGNILDLDWIKRHTNSSVYTENHISTHLDIKTIKSQLTATLL